MLGANVQDVRWPACGEIDIMEVFGHRRGRMSCSTVHNPMHSWGTKDPLDGGCVDLGTDGQPAFHTWKLLWTPDAIAFYFDDDEETPIWVLEVDYVRVYELSSASLPTQVAEDATHAAEGAEQSASSSPTGEAARAEELDGVGGEWRASAAKVELVPSWRSQSLGVVPSGARSVSAYALKSAWTSSLAPSASPAASSPWSPWSPLLLMMMAAVVAALSLWGARRRSKARITTAGLSVALLEEGTRTAVPAAA